MKAPPPSSPSRRLASRVAALCSLAALLASEGALAQSEAQKPNPNVLLLVDSSGSMEFKIDGDPPFCDPANLASERSRWIELVEVLTGTFRNYSCWSQPRTGADFLNEFSLGGVRPYDYNYVNAYHRAVSKVGTSRCVYGPGVLPSSANPAEWPTRGVNNFPLVFGASGWALNRPGTLSTYAGCSSPTNLQVSDGLLDIYDKLVRFGLMTFDTKEDARQGLSGSSADYAGGIAGTWSYYGAGSPVQGTLPACLPTDQEVGARNQYAPPWEGRLVPFGAPDASAADSTLRNNRIQEVLLSTRPYGATPIAGQLADARTFLFSDASIGPVNDPNWQAENCRKTILILLTDGEPNLDLRPFCEAAGGACPYERPADIVRSLRNAPEAPRTHMDVETYVIGFALGSVLPAGSAAPVSCDELTDEQCANPANASLEEQRRTKLQACCTLNEIAAAGGEDSEGVPRKAYFAENRAELKAVFTDILDDVIQVATRTMPVFSNAGGDAASRGYKFFSAFDPQPDPTTPRLWEGILERRRFVCTELQPVLEYDPTKGDDFAANLNSGPTSRRFYSVVGTASGNSMRPFLDADTDGIGTGAGTQVVADGPGNLAPILPASALGIADASLPSGCTGAADANACRDLIVKHLVGVDNGTEHTRCPAGEPCALFGGIYHSVPTPVPGRPSDLLRDESYEAFVRRMFELKRPSVLYTSTVDGFLHAFNLAPHPGTEGAASRAVTTRTNNELWAFLPPAVLPHLHAQYPTTPAVMLDGVPVIKDVVATVVGTSPPVVSAYERRRADAQSGGGSWRTVLVQGFGGDSAVESGYFALDVTEPDPSLSQRPIFRWQLTRDSTGAALFGKGGTPLITTVFLDADENGPREVAVAVLPGGDAPAGVGASATKGPIMDAEPSDFKTDRAVRNYAGQENARSLTIVRLDTGAVVRTFRPATGAGPFDTDVFTATDIPAPITGQPKAFPETTGAVADRIYVGDRDGRLWRVDVSSQDSAQWKMEVFFDAFYDETTTGAGQPVVLPPVLSVDEVGDVTVAFATGSQDLDLTSNRVVSLTETLEQQADQTFEVVAKVNWIHRLAAGYRVTGPMVLYNLGLYYSAARPPETTGSACDVGRSRVYGAHYLESADFDTATESAPPDPNTGPAPAPGGDEDTATLLLDEKAGLVFGVSLEAEPSCFSETEVIGGDESFGYGEVRMSTTVNPGRYFLSYAASGNSTGSDNRGVLEVRQELDRPRLSVKFDSWAVVYE